jgi:hypothetical protein
MTQQTITPAAKRSPLLPLAAGLLAALAYGAGVITTMVIGSPSHGSLAAPVAAPGQAPVINIHRIVPGPNEY